MTPVSLQCSQDIWVVCGFIRKTSMSKRVVGWMWCSSHRCSSHRWEGHRSLCFRLDIFFRTVLNYAKLKDASYASFYQTFENSLLYRLKCVNLKKTVAPLKISGWMPDGNLWSLSFRLGTCYYHLLPDISNWCQNPTSFDCIWIFLKWFSGFS